MIDDNENSDVPLEEKLCTKTSYGNRINLRELRSLVRDSKYVCTTCGRAASRMESLCSPEML